MVKSATQSGWFDEGPPRGPAQGCAFEEGDAGAQCENAGSVHLYRGGASVPAVLCPRQPILAWLPGDWLYHDNATVEAITSNRLNPTALTGIAGLDIVSGFQAVGAFRGRAPHYRRPALRRNRLQT
jgi:hypothetical protein